MRPSVAIEQGTNHHGIKARGAADEWNVQIILGVLRHSSGYDELVDLLRSDLFCVTAHDEVNFVRGAINLSEQALQINCAAGAGGRDDKLHSAKESHSPSEH